MSTDLLKRPPIYITAALAFSMVLCYCSSRENLEFISAVMVAVSTVGIMFLIILCSNKLVFMIGGTAFVMIPIAVLMMLNLADKEEYAVQYDQCRATVQGRVYNVSIKDNQCTAFLKVDSVDNHDVTPFNVAVYAHIDNVMPEKYDVVEAELEISTIPLGLYSDNNKNSYRSKNIFVQAQGDIVKVCESAKGIYSVLNRIVAKMQKIIGKLDCSDFIKALVIGDKDDLDSDYYQRFSNAGVSHILALSGLHISIILTTLCTLTQSISLHRKVYSLLALMVVAFYITITGFSHSVTRAGIMAVFVIVSSFVFVHADSLNSLCISLMIMLIADPYSIGNVSLQLSFVSTLAILVAGVPITVKINSFLAKTIYDSRVPFLCKATRKIIMAVITPVIITWSAMVFTFSIVINNLNDPSVVSLISNIIIIPQTTFIVAGAVVYLILNFIPFLRGFAEYIVKPLTELLVGCLNETVDFFSSMELGSVSIEPDFRKVSEAVIMIAVLVLILKNSKAVHYICFSILVTVAVVIWNISAPLTAKHQLHYINYRDSGTIIFRHNKNITVYKAFGDFSYSVEEFCSEYNIKNIDCVIVPALDENYQKHFDSLYNYGYKIDKILHCPLYYDDAEYNHLAEEYFSSRGSEFEYYDYSDITATDMLRFEISMRSYKAYSLKAEFFGKTVIHATNLADTVSPNPVDISCGDILIIDANKDVVAEGVMPNAEYFLFNFSDYTKYFRKVFKDFNIHDLESARVHIFTLGNDKISMRSIG